MRHRGCVALILATFLVGAVACTGSGASDGQPVGGSWSPVAPSASLATTTTTTESAAPTTDPEPEPPSPANMTELEALWAEQRQVVIDRIQAEGFGLGPDGVITGAGGFTIDTAACPEGWSDTEGIGDAIVIGRTVAQSGGLGIIEGTAGLQAYFDYVNDNGGIAGKRIELIVKDDGHQAHVAVSLVDEFLEDVKPFAIWTTGSPTSAAVYDKLNERCVPHPLTVSGSPAWGDPIGHPWTTGSWLPYSTEAQLWGEWIEANLPDRLPVKVVGLVMASGFPRAYEQGMERYAAAHPEVVSEFVSVRHEPSDPSLAEEMAVVGGEQPDVFIAMTAGNPCLAAVEGAFDAGLGGPDTVRFMPSVCEDRNSFMIPAGDAAEGWMIATGAMKSTTDPAYAGDPWVSFVNETLAAARLDQSQRFYGIEVSHHGWPLVEILRIAAELDGGLTRSNFITAARHFTGVHPGVFDGIAYEMDGNNDAFYLEGSQFARYDVATAWWIPEGDLIDLNGQTPKCSWGRSGCD